MEKSITIAAKVKNSNLPAYSETFVKMVKCIVSHFNTNGLVPELGKCRSLKFMGHKIKFGYMPNDFDNLVIFIDDRYNQINLSEKYNLYQMSMYNDFTYYEEAEALSNDAKSMEEMVKCIVGYLIFCNLDQFETFRWLRFLNHSIYFEVSEDNRVSIYIDNDKCYSDDKKRLSSSAKSSRKRTTN